MKLRKALEEFIRSAVLDAGYAVIPREKWPVVLKKKASSHPHDWGHVVAVKAGRAILFAAVGEQGETESKVHVLAFPEHGEIDDAPSLVSDIFGGQGSPPH